MSGICLPRCWLLTSRCYQPGAWAGSLGPGAGEPGRLCQVAPATHRPLLTFRPLGNIHTVHTSLPPSLSKTQNTNSIILWSVIDKLLFTLTLETWNTKDPAVNFNTFKGHFIRIFCFLHFSWISSLVKRHFYLPLVISWISPYVILSKFSSLYTLCLGGLSSGVGRCAVCRVRPVPGYIQSRAMLGVSSSAAPSPHVGPLHLVTENTNDTLP